VSGAAAYDTSRPYRAALVVGRIRRETGRRIAARARRRRVAALLHAAGIWLTAALAWCLTALARWRAR
jgi:hypothetical protein